MKKNFLRKVCSLSLNEDRFDKGIYTFLNPYSYLVLRKHPVYLSEMDGVFFDGAALVKLLNLVGVRSERISFDFTSLAKSVFDNAIEEKKRIYFIGADEGLAELAVSKIVDRYKGLEIAGCHSGFFKYDDRDGVIKEIIEIKPDIVVVGMGALLQEMFLIDLKSAGWMGKGYTCGGFLHQTASHGMKYYPDWVNKLGIRWMYRIYDEPKLVKRYFIIYPWFLLVFFKDFIYYKIFGSRDFS